MERAIVLALSVILALVVAAPTVLARSDNGNNGTAPVPFTDDRTVEPGDAGGSCDEPPFTLQLALSGKGKDITLPDGSHIFTSPGLFVTATNLDTPENQATFSITGAFHVTTAANGDVTYKITGRNLLSDPDAGYVLLSGNFSFVFDKDGNLIKAFDDPPTGNGQVIDVCALLS
jgi:hypothetical protein